MNIAAAFDPDHDGDGRRQRALSLYGISERFRATDGFVAALDQVSACAMHFAGAAGAGVVLWPGHDPVVLSRCGSEISQSELGHLWSRQSRRSDLHVETAVGDDPTTAVTGTAVTGHDQLRLGLLVVKHPSSAVMDHHTRVLLENLARACAAALDERRHVVSRRRDPMPPSLRVVSGPDRRRREH